MGTPGCGTLRSDLIDNPERREETRRFLDAARVYQERAIFDLLSQVTTAAEEAGTGLRARLEYRGGGLHLAVSATSEDDAGTLFGRDEDVERLTLRLPARLKGLIDQTASSRGVSVNGWIVRALTRAVLYQTRGRTRGEDIPAWPGPRALGRRRHDPPEQAAGD